MRTIISISLLFAVSAACFAQNVLEVDKLIKGGLNKNFESIQREAADLDESERLNLYNWNKMSRWLWIGALIPYGIGNFIQEDFLWGGLVLAGEVLGVGLFCTGATMFLAPIVAVYPLFIQQGQKTIEIGMYLMPIGGATIVVSYIVGVMRAFTHPPLYNKKLRTALHLDNTTLSIKPSINVNRNGVALTLVSATF